MTQVRMPRLLNDALQERARLTPLKLTLHRRLLTLSEAVMILPADAPDVALRDLIELYDENGSAGIYRVREVTETVSSTRILTLEHGLCTFRDGVMPAQGFMCPVAEAFSRLLEIQPEPRWALGDVEVEDDLTIIFATEYTNLLTALETLLEMLPDGYALDYDQSVTPWLLHVRHLSPEVSCEGRLSRNLQSIRYTLDGSRLCTRVYPFGVEMETGRINLVPLDGSDHVQSEAADTLGVISHTFSNDLIFDVPTLNDVALRYLDRHAEPEVEITVGALDFSQATGESLDAFRMGRLCRICLPDIGLTLCERIVAIDQKDVYGAPGQVTLTLSNRLRQRTEDEEIELLLRQATASKLLGGTVTEVVSKNRAFGSYTAPVVHYFDIEDWPALLDVNIAYKADVGFTVQALKVDGVHPDDAVWKKRSFSAMPYLKRDNLGQIARGQHWVSFNPTDSSWTGTGGVTSTVTMTVIDQTVT